MIAEAQITLKRIRRNINVKGDSSGSSEGSKEDDGKCFYNLRGCIYHHEQIANRYVNIKCAYDEISKGNKSTFLETEGKAILVIKWCKIWLNCILLLDGNDELVYLANISKVIIEGEAWFILSIYSKREEEIDKLWRKQVKGIRT